MPYRNVQKWPLCAASWEAPVELCGDLRRRNDLVVRRFGNRELEDSTLLNLGDQHPAEADGHKRRRSPVSRNIEDVDPDAVLVELNDVEHVTTESVTRLVHPTEFRPENRGRTARQVR